MTRREDNVNLDLRRFMRRFSPLLRSTEDPMPTEPATALISNDIVGLGLIAATLA